MVYEAQHRREKTKVKNVYLTKDKLFLCGSVCIKWGDSLYPIRFCEN